MSDQVSQADMYFDEFQRIRVAAMRFNEETDQVTTACIVGSISGICGRAMSDIRRRFPVIEENEKRGVKLERARILLEEIKDWMMQNDYECGDQGSDIYDRISEFLK